MFTKYNIPRLSSFPTDIILNDKNIWQRTTIASNMNKNKLIKYCKMTLQSLKISI